MRGKELVVAGLSQKVFIVLYGKLSNRHFGSDRTLLTPRRLLQMGPVWPMLGILPLHLRNKRRIRSFEFG